MAGSLCGYSLGRCCWGDRAVRLRLGLCRGPGSPRPPGPHPGVAARDDFRSLCFLFTCRANLVLADFVREVFWPRYAAGGTSVSKDDSLNFIKSGVSDGRTQVRWSETTVKRVSSYLLGACADFGLLGAMKAGARSITTFRISSNVASVIAHDLHFRGLGDNALLRSPDWELFGLDAEGALGELKRLALRGEVIVQSAGGITQVSWKYKSLEEVVGALAQS